jgi:hypothetical protein
MLNPCVHMCLNLLYLSHFLKAALDVTLRERERERERENVAAPAGIVEDA